MILNIQRPIVRITYVALAICVAIAYIVIGGPITAVVGIIAFFIQLFALAETLQYVYRLVSRFCSAMCDPKHKVAVLSTCCTLMLFEVILCAGIIRLVPYTEIDWVAYMQEVGGVEKGEYDYAKLEGDTGPCVYPAGFVWLFLGIKKVTGGKIFPAQLLFMVLYLYTQMVVMWMNYRSGIVPPYAYVLLTLSKRLHSIYLLRLFNDPWAMVIAYSAVVTLLEGTKFIELGIVLFSLAVSIKMNVLLWAPGVLFVAIMSFPLHRIVLGTALGTALQLVLAAPFLATQPYSYLQRAFELTRAFQYQWTVNWRMLPPAIFNAAPFHVCLMVGHAVVLVLAAYYWWRPSARALLNTQDKRVPPGGDKREEFAAEQSDGVYRNTRGSASSSSTTRSSSTRTVKGGEASAGNASEMDGAGQTPNELVLSVVQQYRQIKQYVSDRVPIVGTLWSTGESTVGWVASRSDWVLWLLQRYGVARYLSVGMSVVQLVAPELDIKQQKQVPKKSNSAVYNKVMQVLERRDVEEDDVGWAVGGPRWRAWATSVMVTSQFIGIVFARSLHFQFYSWYAHTIPLLLWCTDWAWYINFGVWGLLELMWNVFPQTAFSSSVLLVLHVAILAAHKPPVGSWCRRSRRAVWLTKRAEQRDRIIAKVKQSFPSKFKFK